MDVVIEKGSTAHLNDCEEALLNSALGEKYFSREGSAKNAILEGLSSGNLYTAFADKECAGFFYLIPNGAFHGFPYLHLLAVREKYRGKGVGTALLGFAEDIAFETADKLFLVVADFNPDAKRFYERNGYRQAGEIPGLYRSGITEYLMMKEKG